MIIFEILFCILLGATFILGVFFLLYFWAGMFAGVCMFFRSLFKHTHKQNKYGLNSTFRFGDANTTRHLYDKETVSAYPDYLQRALGRK